MTYPAAKKAIQKLESMGVLKRRLEKENRMFIAHEILELLS
ncbi:MAG: hypothetical protein ABI361_09300 [Nitrososphaera sp.]|jgi:enoyl-[acyl-carrier-protein] reductase (NADH)